MKRKEKKRKTEYIGSIYSRRKCIINKYRRGSCMMRAILYLYELLYKTSDLRIYLLYMCVRAVALYFIFSSSSSFFFFFFFLHFTLRARMPSSIIFFSLHIIKVLLLCFFASIINESHKCIDLQRHTRLTSAFVSYTSCKILLYFFAFR